MQTTRASKPPARIARLFGAVALGALGTALFLTGCSRTSSTAGRGVAAIPVQIGKATLQTMPVTQSSIGSVQSLRTVTVKSQVDGVISAVRFREGDEVEAGDLLISLDRRPFENNLLSARAELANARAQGAHAQAEFERPAFRRAWAAR